MREALIVWGGWSGHEPEQCAKIIAGMLEGDGTKFIDGLQGANQFAVSREPAGGSATPTDIIGGVSFQP